MTKKPAAKPNKRTRRKTAAKVPLWRRIWRWRLVRWLRWGVLAAVMVVLLFVSAFGIVNPPTTPYIVSEARRLGSVQRQWIALDRMSPDLARAVVAAEDANFCLHWGFDMAAIRAAIDEGAERGASTLSQQVTKNVFLWQRRSWPRKALEAGLTPLVEAIWSKERIVEVYLNVAEFGEGIFGVQAAARHYFGVSASEVTAAQAALLAAVLPAPKTRSASKPSDFVRRRAGSIRDGAATIRADGRSDCFES
ncbi:MAG: monofunctional biosynthetic peptidoglycan transglycosylase [Alphaproteobacteria bacterium]|nr:monofunctional biosynthetic peptidoglycan transglycosylase [Alphaproteobacteria bacterium]